MAQSNDMVIIKLMEIKAKLAEVDAKLHVLSEKRFALAEALAVGVESLLSIDSDSPEVEVVRVMQR